jgi:hypothetical protein
VRKSPHLVIESMGMSTINLGKCESQHAWEKRKFEWEKEDSFYLLILGARGEWGVEKRPTMLCL